MATVPRFFVIPVSRERHVVNRVSNPAFSGIRAGYTLT
jgi:hypothetical protein